MEIINYTHYSTEDLKQFVAHIESEKGFQKWRTDGPLVFQEFDPKNPYITDRRRWSLNKSGDKAKRFVSKMRWADMNSISLLVPRKIFDNPIQALTQDENVTAPAGMIEQIVLALRERRHSDFIAMRETADVALNLPLRVLDKVEAKKPKTDKKAIEGARKEYIKRNLRHFGWETRKAARELTKGHQKQVKAAAHHLREEKFRLDAIDIAFSDAVRALARLESVINTIETAV